MELDDDTAVTVGALTVKALKEQVGHENTIKLRRLYLSVSRS